jgi:hypothetical protein
MPQQTPNLFTYPRNEPGTTGHFDLVDALRSLPRDLADALKGITDGEATFRATPDGWCIREIPVTCATPLRSTTSVYMMSTQTDPVRCRTTRKHSQRTRVHAQHRRCCANSPTGVPTPNLLTTLVNWNWARTGQHLESGRMSIRQIVEHMVEHEGEHLHDIRTLRAAASA